MSNRILFEDDIDEQTLTKAISRNSNKDITIKQEYLTVEGNCASENNVLVDSEPQDTVNDEQPTEKRIQNEISEIHDAVLNSNDNCEGNSSQVEDLGSKNTNKNSKGNTDHHNSRDDNAHVDKYFEMPIESVIDQRGNIGQNDNGKDKTNQSSIDGQDKGNKVKGKKRPSELELLGVDIKVNFEDTEGKYDVFGDDNQIFKKYKLRKSEQQISYKEPTDWKPKRRVSLDDEPISLICTVCFKEFESKKALQLHIRSHETVLEYKCSLCSQIFNKNADLIAHKFTHTSESFLCKLCKVAFSDHCDFLQHKLTHATQSKFTCPECGLSYNRYSYKLHIYTHFDKKVSCPICPFITNGEFNLQRHLNEHNYKKITCVECGKLCQSRKAYEYHMGTHTGVKKYQCLYCGRCFSTNSMREVHTRIHTGNKPYTCDICGHKSTQSVDMKRHKVTHETEKKYWCDLCPKKYFYKYYLIIHMRSHTKKSLYKCPECDSTFISPGGLKVHMMFKHLSDRPVECTLCDKKFINNNQFKKHSRSKYHKRNMYGHMMEKEKDNE